MRFTDPLGLKSKEDEDNFGASGKAKGKRIVYIFVGFEIDHQRTYRNYDPTRGFSNQQGATNPPQFARQAAAANLGDEADVRLYTGADVTLDNLTAALQNAAAYAVIFIGHGSNDPSDGAEPYFPFWGVFTNDPMSSNPHSSLLQVSARNIAVFTCNSQFVSNLWVPGDGLGPSQSSYESFIGVDSGSDGYTNTGTLSRMGFAAAAQFISGRGPDAALSAANSALREHPRDSIGSFGRPTMDNGDSVRRKR